LVILLESIRQFFSRQSVTIVFVVVGEELLHIKFPLLATGGQRLDNVLDVDLDTGWTSLLSSLAV
jgi:hypothetical protein